MNSNDRIELFEKMPVKRAVIKQIMPAVAAQMVAVIYSLADTYFVGMLNSPAQTAAVTVVAPCFIMLTAVANLFGVGGSSLIARKLGQHLEQEAREVSSVTFWWGLISALAFCLLGLGLQRLPGVGFSGKLSWGLALVCLVLLGLSRLSRRHRGWKILLRIAQIGLAALVLGLSAVEIWVIRAGHRDESSQPADAVIVLGAGVNGTTPSVALQTRIDAAERYLKAHPDIPAVLSGGQGPGEDISEARAMYDALTDRGIDPERLILEEQSANTRQNLQNSLALLPDDYHKTVAIVTNDFHMGRVRLLLNAAGPGRVVQVPAKLPWWWLSANYYLRESFAVVNDQVVRPLLA